MSVLTRRLTWLDCLLLVGAIFLIGSLLFPLGMAPPGPAIRARAERDVGVIVTALKQYQKEYAAMPEGDSARIMKALRGANPRSIVFLEEPSNHFNDRGEFIDPWQNPYRIDAIDATFPWAYSFGRNGRDDGGAPGSDDIASWR